MTGNSQMGILMPMKWGACAVAVLVAVVGIGCQRQPAPSREAVDTAPPPPPVAAPSVGCVGPIVSGAPRSITLGQSIWELDGSTLRWVSGAQRETLVVGALADIKEASAINLDNVRAIAAWFRQHRVDVIVNAGDAGEQPGEIEASLAILAELSVPVLNIIGNREGLAAYTAAMRSASEHYANVFDLRTVRKVHTPQVDIVSLPGYFNRSFIHSDDGCQYQPEDVQALSRLVADSTVPVLLVSHGPPRQAGPTALDRTSEGTNVGDPRLAEVLSRVNVPFGIFGNIHEAGGRGTDLLGTKRLAERVFHGRLYINPGPADAMVWRMNDGSVANGMAAVLTVRGREASYVVHRLPRRGGR